LKILSRLGRAVLYLTALTGLASFVYDDQSTFGRTLRRVAGAWIVLGFIYSLPGIRRTFGWQAEFRKSAWLLAGVLACLWLVRWLMRRFPGQDDIADPAEPYALVFNEGPHVAGGPHEIAGAMCPNCGIPLVRLLKFDPSDARLHLRGDPVHLMYCFSCRIARGGVLSYRIDGPDRVTLLEWERDEPGAAFDLVPARPADLRSGGSGEYQVGGKPAWLTEGLTCPSCNRPMPFLAAIGLGEWQAVYHFCRDCRVVTAYPRQGS
jgi:hypothetical protein